MISSDTSVETVITPAQKHAAEKDLKASLDYAASKGVNLVFTSDAVFGKEATNAAIGITPGTLPKEPAPKYDPPKILPTSDPVR